MSQKSSLPQPTQSVSRGLTADNRGYHACPRLWRRDARQIGLATAQVGTARFGRRHVTVRWLMITDLGQSTISDVFNRRSPSAPPR
jgi:hypothetical protein